MQLIMIITIIHGYFGERILEIEIVIVIIIQTKDEQLVIGIGHNRK